MRFAQNSMDAGHVIAARLKQATLGQLQPELRRMLVGRQLFIQQPNGEYRPKGSQLGMAHYFRFTDLEAT